jgi:pimeloyl-ACP methyl ester carboxylesterase
MTPDQARTAIRTLGTSPGFDAALRATARRHDVSSLPIDAPVTVAFGSRDLLLLRHRSLRVERLPPGTHVGQLPGCGHIPMTDDPAAVTALIDAATARGLSGETQAG